MRFEEAVADVVNILSLHPYKWPDLETPEEWHGQFINKVRGLMEEYGGILPIWYTEVGAPRNDAGVPQMYSDGHPVRALTRREEVDYLVKVPVLALRAGVEKIIWHNHRGRGCNATDVEDRFGLRDFWAVTLDCGFCIVVCHPEEFKRFAKVPVGSGCAGGALPPQPAQSRDEPIRG